MVQIQQHLLAALVLLPLAAAPAPAQKFYPDDPLWREPPPLPVPKALQREINDYYDFFRNTFWEPDKQEIKDHDPAPSQAINTLGEVPDSTWFTNRIGSRPMTIQGLVRGPGDSHAPSENGPWTILSSKNQGIQPGMVFRDSSGRRYYLKFDARKYPDLASAADVISAKFFYDLGYNTPENYIVHFTRSQLRVNPKSSYKTPQGGKRPMTGRDLDAILAKAPRDREGRYRGMASLSVPGEALGPFHYDGTRADDPNDIVDHENRRDLRGLYVFAEWLNHTDSKSINSLDSLVEENGLRYVKHYLIDFGATLGSDSFEPKSPRAGHVYLFSWVPSASQFLSLGLDVPAWMLAQYPDIPGVGHFEYEHFDPEHWVNNYHNPAFDLRTPGDTYWAAKKVMAFSDEAIRSIVATGEYDDPRAVDWIARCLVERRERIGRAYFNDVLPLDNFAVRGGKLAFDDLAVLHGFHAARQYSVKWAEFDNQTGRTTPIPEADSFALPRSAAEYLAAEIRAEDPQKTVTVYLHGGRVVGIDRTWPSVT